MTIYALAAISGDITRFANSRKLVSYLGFNPGVLESGNYEGGGALHSHGRGSLRALLIQPSKRPLKIFILASHSNMEGHAKIETFDYIGDDPATAPLLKQMRGAKSVTKDIKRVCPAYDEKQGYEIAGFVWLQGFNDLVASETYPSKPGGKARDYSQYGEWLADFIRDVRKDFAAPKMPFVIGVLGVSGLNADENTKSFREAMTAPAALPEFAGNVFAVQTAPFRAEELGAIADKREKVSQMSYFLNSKHKDHPTPKPRSK